MFRSSSVSAGICCFVIAIASVSFSQDSTPVNNTVQVVPMNQISAYSAQPGVAVIGSFVAPGHGHVVTVVPGTNRVWDGNILGGFKDLTNGIPVTDQTAINGMNRVVNGGSGGGLNVQTMTGDQLTQFAGQYMQFGAPISYSFRASAVPSIVWYQVPTTQNLNQVIQNYQPPPATAVDPATGNSINIQGLRCNSLVQQAVPAVSQQLVFDDSVPKNSNNSSVNLTANQIDSALFSMSNTGSQASTPVVQPPPSPPVVPLYNATPMQMNVIPKPGGVFITATAEIDGLRPDDVASAKFDLASGSLAFLLRTGTKVVCPLDADDFAIATRCVFQNEVDPALSMESGKKDGYNEVVYCGPLFKTKFGETLYRTDRLLGEIIFNREGPNRSIAADLIPGYTDLVCESHGTMAYGSRVFLRATDARFSVAGDRLVCKGVHTKVDVEGLRYASSYYHESFHRMARLLNENMATLHETFEEFQELDKLSQCVALAKWIKKNAISFDWSELASRGVAVKEFPSYSPNTAWYSLFNGVNLDGWRIDVAAGGLDWKRKQASVVIRPAGQSAVKIAAETWYSSYDLKYGVITSGPIDFIVRDGTGVGSASFSLDTKGKAKLIELFLVDGKWTAIAPGFGTTGQVTMPKPAKSEDKEPNVYGFRVPPGSELALFTASFRGRK